MNEAHIVINGQTLSEGEAMTLRVAMESFAGDLARNGLGTDENGVAICTGYLRQINSLRIKMGYGSEK